MLMNRCKTKDQKKGKLGSAFALLCLYLLSAQAVYAIRDGSIAPAGKYPFTISLHTLGKESPAELHQSCGATLVGERHLLTAGHCVEGLDDISLTRAVFSDGDHTSPNRKVVPIKHIVFPRDYYFDEHAAFSPSYINLDMALIELVSPVDLPSVQLPVLPLESQIGVGSTLSVQGWGKVSETQSAEQLKEAEILLTEPAICQQQNALFDQDKEFCVDALTGIWCTGDSGGPLMLNVDDQLFQVGLVSRRSYECASPKKGIAVRVFPQLEWITHQQRVSYPGVERVRLGVGRKVIRKLQVTNRHTEPMPLGNVVFTLHQSEQTHGFEVISDTCTGATLDPQASCAFDVELRANAAGSAKLMFEAPINSDEFTDIIGYLDMVAFASFDVSQTINQGVSLDIPNSQQLFFSNLDTNHWHIQPRGDNKPGSIATLSTASDITATLSTTFAKKGRLTADVQLDIPDAENAAAELMVLVNSRLVPLQDETYYLTQKTDGFVTVEIDLLEDNAEVTFLLFKQYWMPDPSMSFASISFQPSDTSGTQPAPTPQPGNGTENGGSGGGSAFTLLFLLALLLPTKFLVCFSAPPFKWPGYAKT